MPARGVRDVHASKEASCPPLARDHTARPGADLAHMEVDLAVEIDVGLTVERVLRLRQVWSAIV